MIDQSSWCPLYPLATASPNPSSPSPLTSTAPPQGSEIRYSGIEMMRKSMSRARIRFPGSASGGIPASGSGAPNPRPLPYGSFGGGGGGGGGGALPYG
ncbi:hypothetical protein DER30_4133 [Streptomyces sp. HB202]|nr:hypothetical protein DER30_4133 [Streptomyces sp. HB202]